MLINGKVHEVEAKPGAMLLDVLRDQLRLTGAKPGCRRGECGACTVLVGGRPILSCIQLACLVDGPVVTIEGLGPELDPLREAFADCGGFQCGYCTPGQLVQAFALIQAGLPSDAGEAEQAVRRGMSGNVCRCTGYAGIVAAVMRVARGEVTA
jgi:aerobic-type carbon monoxide dehydrogenase small subunit (CoxS/CutS family)